MFVSPGFWPLVELPLAIRVLFSLEFPCEVRALPEFEELLFLAGFALEVVAIELSREEFPATFGFLVPPLLLGLFRSVPLVGADVFKLLPAEFGLLPVVLLFLLPAAILFPDEELFPCVEVVVEGELLFPIPLLEPEELFPC